MKFDNMSKEKQNELLQKLQGAENKSQAILEVIEEINKSSHSEIIQKITEESERASVDSKFKEKLGLRVLNKEEKEFYAKLKDVNQSIKAEQIDMFPISVIDNTLANVKKKSRISELITFTPADVKKWIIAEKTGKAHWGSLTKTLTEEMSATFTSLNIEVGKMYAMIVIPKAIRDLSDEFVDRYIMAILEEALNDGIASSFIDGTGVDMPIGILRLTSSKLESGEAKPKTIISTITGFAPKQLKEVKKVLSNGGLRIIGELKLICNPGDNYEYVEPSLYGENADGTYTQKSNTKIDVIEDINCPAGKGIFTLPNLYTMGFSGFKVDEYKETLAKDDANLLIGKCYGNGRAVDDNTSVVFDITKLEEYVQKVVVVNQAAATK